MMTINKELLKNVRFSNLVSAWVLQAQSFRYCAEFVRKGGNPPVMKGGFISSENAYLSNSAHKIACYMVAHAIELSLKALYCLHSGQNVEHFNHNAIKLVNKLIEMKILEKNEINMDDFELINVFLEWYGRYHKPTTRRIDEVIEKYFIPTAENSDMLKPKFSIDTQTLGKLSTISDFLFGKISIRPSFYDQLLFDLF